MSNQIAFTGWLERPPTTGYSQHNLYLLDAAQAAPQQLTLDLSIHRFSWSPDGGRLAFVASSVLRGKPVEILYLLEPGRLNLRRLPDGTGGILWNWSPDGKRLAFTCFEEAFGVAWPSPRGALFIMDLERDELRHLTREAAYAVWSEETSEIAFCWTHDTHSITVMDADGTNPRLLFQSRLPVTPYRWSQSGQFLACRVASRSHWGAGEKNFDRLQVCDAQGKVGWQKEWELGLHTLAWSPDSQRIACIAPAETEEDEGEPCVFAMGRDGSGLQPLGITESESEVAWSPDTQKIAFIGHDIPGKYTLEVHEVDRQHHWSYPMEGVDPTGDLWPHVPTWSPDSQQLAYNGPAHRHLHVVKLNEPFPFLFTNNTWQLFNEEEQEDREERANSTDLILDPAWQPEASGFR